MRVSRVVVAMLLAVSGWAAAEAAIIHDFNSGIGPVANHPYPTSAFGTWYDITSDAFATPSAGTLDGSPSLSITDGGFTNGVYTILENIIPATGMYRLEALMKVNEIAGATNGIRAYQLGAVVNGVHRSDAVTPNDIAPINVANPGSGIGNYVGLSTGDDSALTAQIVATNTFFANAGDELLVAFSTDLAPGTGTGDFDDNSGTWAAGTHVLVDNLNLVQIPEPTSAALGAIGCVALAQLARRRRIG